MEKYKICPACHEKNEPTLLECAFCEADLTRVRITDAETERQESPAQPGLDLSPVRLCECGAANPANARKCAACGEDISDVTPTVPASPTPASEPEAAPECAACVLSSLDGTYAFEITAPEIIIGREHEMSAYLAAHGYVSRTHARLILEEGALFIENLSNTNFTYVNNLRIEGRTRLMDGDEIGLGGIEISGSRQQEAAYFFARIPACM